MSGLLSTSMTIRSGSLAPADAKSDLSCRFRGSHYLHGCSKATSPYTVIAQSFANGDIASDDALAEKAAGLFPRSDEWKIWTS